MAIADIVQVGTTVSVGFQGVSYGTWVLDSSSESPGADIAEIRDEHNAVITKLVSEPVKVYELTGIILGSPEATYTLAAARLLIIGATVTINSNTCRITALKINYTPLAAKISMTAVDEAIALA